MSRTKTDRGTDREPYTNDTTARPLNIGETGRNLNTRLTEHKRATRNGDIKNNIAEHHFWRNSKSTGTLQHALHILQTTINDSLLER